MADLNLGAQFLTLVAVVEAQRDVHAAAYVDAERRVATHVDAEGGVGRTVGHREAMVGFGFAHGLFGGAQVGPQILRRGSQVVELLHVGVEVEGSGDVEAVDGIVVVEHRLERNLGRAQIDLRGGVVGLVLDALQFHALQIHLRDVAGAVAVARDAELPVEVVQVLFGHNLHRFRLENLDEGGAQREQHGALQIGLLQFGDRGCLLRAFEAQFALVGAFMQVSEAHCGKELLQRPDRRNELELIERHGHVRIRLQEGRDLARLSLLHARFPREQRRVRDPKLLFHLLPRQRRLRLRGRARKQRSHGRERGAPRPP